MSVLRWDKPARVMPEKEWKAISADGAPPGAYTPNMSRGDQYAWKARLIGGEDRRVEIRKSAWLPGDWAHGGTSLAQVVLVVRPDGSVVLSANGKAGFCAAEVRQLSAAIAEASAALAGEGAPDAG